MAVVVVVTVVVDASDVLVANDGFVDDSLQVHTRAGTIYYVNTIIR